MAKILIVDDKPTIREVGGLYLKRDGHEVVPTTDGEEALEPSAAPSRASASR